MRKRKGQARQFANQLPRQKHLAAIVESSNDAIISKTPEGIITSWNPGAEKLFGYMEEEAVGQPMLMLFPPERALEEEEILGRIERGERVEGFESVRVTKSGARVDVSITVSPIRDKNGKVIGASTIARDITRRKRAEESLRESEEKFRQLAENINEVFWMTDPAKLEILYVSPAYEKIWGRTCASLYESPTDWAEAVHPQDRDRVLKAAADKQASGEYDEEYRIVRPDQTIRWIRDRAYPIRDASGRVYRIVGTARDITTRKALEEQLRQAQKMEGIGRLAGGVAHDFNNLLAVLQGISDLLKGSPHLTPEQADFADEIEATVQRAAALTRQLLLFSRREIFQPRDLDWADAISTTAKMLNRILGEHVRVELIVPQQPVYIHADASMMDQILMNLAVNARDAMPDGGRLMIELSAVEISEEGASGSSRMRPGPFAKLIVSDTGSGIAPEHLPKIFEPFFTTKGVGKGTGLGLATVFGIVQQHQGWIDVQTQAGRGTTFQIHLPRLARNTFSKFLGTEPVAMSRGNETILLVEDDTALRESMNKTLTRLGYRILEAPTARRALEVWKENKDEIRLMLTDLVMPEGMTGRELARKLERENPALKVIYMSGYSAEALSKDFPLRDGENFLAKPFPTRRLAQIIRKNLDAETETA